jgi:hypothetical protein
MYKSDLIFNILEKYIYFDRSQVSFTKFNYLQDFNLSNGIVLFQKSFIKSSASLFLPELTLYLNKMIENEEKILSETKGPDTSTSVSANDIDVAYLRCLTLLKVIKNDSKFYPHNGIFR